MITADIRADSPGRITLDTEFRDRERVKEIPGARWDAGARTWHAPLAWTTCLALRGVFGADLNIGDNLRAWAGEYRANTVDPVASLRADPLGQNGGAALVRSTVADASWLRPDQKIGVEFLLTADGAVLGDDMGTGKTRMTLSAIATSGATPALVVCPNGVQGGWAREVERAGLPLTVGIARGSAKARREVIEAAGNGDLDVVVIGWEALRRHTRLASYGSVRLAGCVVCEVGSTRKQASCERCPRELNAVEWKTVVADEAHRMKDPKAKQTRAVWAVGHQPSVRWRYALTGTPIADAVDDLWSPLFFVAPHEYPSKTRYIDRYAAKTWNVFGGLVVAGIRSDTRDEFFAGFDAHFLRRPRELVLPEIGEPVRVEREAAMSPAQAKIYRDVADEMLARLDSGDTLLATSPLTQLMRLNQAAAATLTGTDCECTGGQGAETADPGCTRCHGRGRRFRLTEPSSKLDELDDILSELGGQQVVVFAVSRQLIELAAARLEKAGITHIVVSGAVTGAVREAEVAEFAAGRRQVALVVIDAGGEGLDGLQSASTAVFLQRHYSRLKNHQAEGRLLRSGQSGQVVIMDIRSTGTVEDAKELLLAEKEDRFEEVVRDADVLRAALSRRP